MRTMTLSSLVVLLALSVGSAPAAAPASASSRQCSDCGGEAVAGALQPVRAPADRPPVRLPVGETAVLTCAGCEQSPCAATLATWARLWGKWFGVPASAGAAQTINNREEQQ